MIPIKGLIFILVFYLLFADAKLRFRGTRTRFIGSSSNSSSSYSDESPTNPITVILLLFLGISLCGCKIIYKCRQKKKHRERVQQQINDLIDTHNKLMEICTIDQLNKTDFIWMPLSIQSLNDTSQKMMNENEFTQVEDQDSICPQQTTIKEEKQLAVVPIEDVQVSSRPN